MQWILSFERPEDSVSAEFRKDVGLDETSSLSRRLKGQTTTQYSPILVVWMSSAVVLVAFFMSRKVTRDRTGYHKKVDT